jgi:uncharacterized membrane protein
MKELPIRALGMVWYELEDFERIKTMMEDGHRLHRTYTEWRLAAEQGERQFRRQGHLVVRAHLRPDEFIEWCRLNGQKLNAEGRNAFANEVAFKTHGASH